MPQVILHVWQEALLEDEENLVQEEISGEFAPSWKKLHLMMVLCFYIYVVFLLDL